MSQPDKSIEATRHAWSYTSSRGYRLTVYGGHGLRVLLVTPGEAANIELPHEVALDLERWLRERPR